MELTGEIDDLNQQLARAVNRHTAKLLARPGVGPDCAAALLITAGDNPSGWAAKPPTPRCVAPARSRCPRARPSACA